MLSSLLKPSVAYWRQP